ncbi:MAG: peptidoglycan-associated lipoprotein Pal [Rhizobacter sp.]|nr:peptidoglycan-associated lipoprotein Pal [Rhizobacter sp.]
MHYSGAPVRLSILLVSLVTSLLAACSSTPTTPAASSQGTTASTAAPAATPGTSSTAAAPASTMLAAHLDPNSELRRQSSIYFAYDEAVITPQYTPVVERHGQYLMAHQALKVVVQGNTDERGSAEYNLALGQRRAEAVRTALKLYGVKESQVEAVSFGRERPKATGHDETAWAQNRRADIVYQN